MNSARAPWISRAIPLSLLLGLLLAGCEDLGPAAIDEARRHDDPAADSRDQRNEVIVYNTYLVAADQLTYVAGGQQSHPLGRNGSSQSGLTANIGGGLPRANASLVVDNDHGTVFLYWEGKVVEQLEFDRAFFLSGEVEVISYQAADGSIAELHLYGRPDFQPAVPKVATRAQIEAFEH